MSPPSLSELFRRTAATGFWVLVSGALALALFAAGLALYEPFWESNDDSGMSMIAHGYGFTKSPSPLLLYQNVLVGYLLQMLPPLGGVLPYSWLQMALMLVSGWALLYFVVRSGGPLWLAVVALALVFARVIAAPQFTITAGLATAAGILAWLSHCKTPSPGALVAGAFLLVFGYLVRPEEAVFVAIAAMPFVPWTKLPLRRTEMITAAAVIGFVLAATFIDFQHYAGPEWAAFRALDPPRQLLTDFNLSDNALKYPALLRQHGFSSNDVQLIANWFYIDPRVADPERLQALIASVPTQHRLLDNVFRAGEAVRALNDPAIAPLMLSAATLSLLSRCWIRALASWAIFLAVIVYFGFAGRPAVLHTYYPVPVLVLFASLACGLRPEAHRPMLRVVPWAVMLVSLAMMLRFNVAENQEFMERSARAQESVAKLDRGQTHVIWGAALPTELVFPVLSPDTMALDFPHYGLGWESLTPFAIGSFKGTPWRDLPDRIARDRDIPFIASKSHMELLRIYCREHVGGELRMREEPLDEFTVFHATCAKS